MLPERAREAGDRRAWLVGALVRLAPDYTGEIGDDTPLTDGGIGLDSLALIDLVRDVEDHLGIAVAESELVPEHFGTPRLLLRFLEGRTTR